MKRLKEREVRERIVVYFTKGFKDSSYSLMKTLQLNSFLVVVLVVVVVVPSNPIIQSSFVRKSLFSMTLLT